MPSDSKADRIGEVLQALAYHDFDLLGDAVYIRDYDPGLLANEKRVRNKADEQRERHLDLHHGVLADGGSKLEILDDWCLDCSKEFLAGLVGAAYTSDILEHFDKSGDTAKLADREKIVSLVMRILRDLDERHEAGMSMATSAVGAREVLGPLNADDVEGLIRQWDQDCDRVTDFYADLLGRRFPRMIQRAEKLSTIPVRSAVPESVQRYLREASRCYVFGQYIGCLALCRAAIEFALEEFLERNGMGAALKQLAAEKRDGIAARIDLAQTLPRWKLKGSLGDANEIRGWAVIALHQKPIEAERCKELFFKARGVLRDLYS